ncbi:MAG: acetate--CoA ligase family protein, partial [Patescibacteria group bacterium]|nr:acetate--CoA ligase family protein [Patescibacteria group bacterium]
GAIGAYLFDWAKSENLGFSKFVSLGNRSGLTETDFLTYLSADPNTKVIGLYLESFADGKKFLSICSRLTRKKPVVVIFGGQTQVGKNAALSHTAALSPEAVIIKTALAQAGCIQVNSLEAFTDLLEVFSLEPPLTDNDLVIVTNAGGPGILATDKADEVNLKVERLIDVRGDALAEQFNSAFLQVIKDKIKDAFLIILTPQTMTQLELTCQAVVHQFKHIKKPVVVSLLGGEITAKAKEILRKNQIATIDFPQKAVDCLSILFQYWHNRTQQNIYPVRQSAHLKVAPINLEAGQQTWQQIKALTKSYHLPLVLTKIAKEDSLLQLIKEIGFPLVLKADPAETLHRTEKKALFLNLNSPQTVIKHFNQLNSQFKTVLIQPQILAGHELFIGLKQYPDFPPLLTIGSGGIYTEIYQDIAHTFLPLNQTTALKLLAQTKIGQILQGARGLPPINLQPIIKLILHLSQLIQDQPQIQEINVNPVIINQHKIDIVDIKIQA